MDSYSAIFQGVIQGLTEFLPVSSSGHLCLVQHVLGQSENNLFFNVMLHFGTLIAVFAVYYKLIFRLIKSFFLIIFSFFKKDIKKDDAQLEYDKKLIFSMIISLLPLFLLIIPLPFLGMSLKNLAENLYADRYLIVVGIAFLVTGFLMMNAFLAEDAVSKKIKNNFSIKDALAIGFTQFVAAIFPGLSRSGSTLSVAMFRGIDKQTALDFSFIIAIPSILAAVLLELKDLPGNIVQNELIYMAIGVATSAIVGFFAIILFKWMLKSNKMFIFIHYVFIIGFLAIFVAIIELFQSANMFTGMIL